MKRKFTVNEGTFKGETYQQFNGTTVTEVFNKEGTEQMPGRSGNTKAYDTAGGARLFLSDAQVTLV